MSEISDEEREELTDSAVAELRHEDTRSFSVVTIRDDGTLTHTYCNAKEGDSEQDLVSDLQVMLGYEVASWAHEIGTTTKELLVAVVSVLTNDISPRVVDDPTGAVPGVWDQLLGGEDD